MTEEDTNRGDVNRNLVAEEVLSRPLDMSVLNGVDPDLIDRIRKAVKAGPGGGSHVYTHDDLLDVEIESARAEYVRQEAAQKAADLASYPKREDWP